MLLNYFRGQNFGDALNPIIFDRLLPGFFDDDPDIEFSGIGSIIGLPMNVAAKRRIIFSSGFAYGTLPHIDETFDIVCVRGPLTAKILKIDPNLAITDGAILLNALKFPQQEKKYKYSFMPHWESELKYPWERICQEADIHYVSPTLTPEETINEILQSEFIIAEAMHAAIAADTLRVPWLAVKAYRGINEFKWNDWTSTLNLHYSPQKLPSMYSVNDFVLGIFNEKSSIAIPDKLIRLKMKGYEKLQDIFLKPGAIKRMKKLKEGTFQLSDHAIFEQKFNRVYEKLYETRDRYSSLLSKSV